MKLFDNRDLNNQIWFEMLVLLIGVLLITTALLADILGVGGQDGFGAKQILLLILGGGLLLVAIVALIARWRGWDSPLFAIKIRSLDQSVSVPVIGQHIPALDGIRGTAILLVIVFHLGESLWAEFGYTNHLLQFMGFGWMGVDLFFVLSGFLITGILYDSKASAHYFKNFYMRRVLRIFPLYYGALLFILLLRVIWPQDDIYGSANPLWMWAYLTNIGIAWNGVPDFGVAIHFWSLAIEEHFYFLWPLAVFLLNRRRLIQLSVALFILSLGLRIALVWGGIDPGAIYVLTPTRLDGLCMGAFLALAVRRSEGVQQFAKPAWLIAGVSGLIIMAIIIIRRTANDSDPMMQTLGYPILAVFFGAVLILSLSSPLQRLFNFGVLRWFGKYSYGLYVWHFIVFMIIFHSDLARMIRDGSGTIRMILSAGLALGGTFAITLLSWYCWENPFIKLKRYFG